MPVKEEETTQSAGLLWLESVTQSEQPRILLSSDSTGGELMARAEMALFQSQGAVWATPLLPMDRAAYLVMKQKADRALVMSRAKQAALALLMYTQDYDDTLPDGDGLLDKLLPYAKDASIFDGFNYTYPGGPLADIASPAETVIGTMNGPGGHAVIYVDVMCAGNEPRTNFDFHCNLRSSDAFPFSRHSLRAARDWQHRRSGADERCAAP